MPVNMAEAEKKLAQALRQAGMKKTEQRIVTLRAFMNVKKPVSHYELLTAVKQYDISISYHTVMRTMEAIVACGLGRRIANEEKRFKEPARFFPVEAACPHVHLVCRECGALIQHEPEESRDSLPHAGVDPAGGE